MDNIATVVGTLPLVLPDRARVRGIGANHSVGCLEESGNYSSRNVVPSGSTPAASTIILQRAPEPNTYDLGNDCQRGDGMAPELGPAFLTFPCTTLVSDDDGNASLSFHFATPPEAPFEDGTQFDLQFRVIDSTGTSEYRTECFTVTVL